MKRFLNSIMKKIVAFLDPKFAKYRKKPKVETYTPETKKALLALLKRTPVAVLSKEERVVISSAMSFRDRKVKDIMIKKPDITFVHDTDFLGPLLLDKLYKTGLTHFPVINHSGRIVGLLHAANLMNLKIRETDRAKEYLDEDVYYLNENYTSEQALAAFLRTGARFFVVLDRAETPSGVLPADDLIFSIFGHPISDDFDRDLDPRAVSKR